MCVASRHTDIHLQSVCPCLHMHYFHILCECNCLPPEGYYCVSVECFAVLQKNKGMGGVMKTYEPYEIHTNTRARAFH